MPAVLVDQDQDTDSKEVWHLGRPLRVEAPTSLMTHLVASPRVRFQGRDFITAGRRSQTRRFGLYCPAKTLISGDFTLRFHCVYCSSITLFNILQLGHIQINNIILKLRTTNHTIASNYNSFGSTIPSYQRQKYQLISSLEVDFTTTPAQPFYGSFSGTTRVSWCQKRTSGLYGARED